VSIVTLRLFVSIFFLFGFAILLKRLKKIRRKDQPWFILMALFEPFFYFLGEANGLTMVSATVGAVIISTIPLFVPIAAYYLFKERLSPLNILGMAISFGGVLLVILKKGGGFSADPRGILLMFAAVISAVGYTLVVRKLIDDYNPITLTAYQSFYGLLMFSPLFLIRELPHAEPGCSHQLSSLLSVIYLGVVGSGLCFILLTIGIREVRSGQSQHLRQHCSGGGCHPILFLLKEAMPLIKVLGIAVTIGGLFLSQLSTTNWKMPARRNGFRHPPYS
jgi:drug/metabolite transporter (DMT)-like permease